jgi:hypothetical protein
MIVGDVRSSTQNGRTQVFLILAARVFGCGSEVTKRGDIFLRATISPPSKNLRLVARNLRLSGGFGSTKA